MIPANPAEPPAPPAVDIVDAETKLRQILSECAMAIGNGARADPECSIEFISRIPKEIAGERRLLVEQLERYATILRHEREYSGKLNATIARLSSQVATAREASDLAIQGAAMLMGSTDEWTDQGSMIADFQRRLDALIADLDRLKSQLEDCRHTNAITEWNLGAEQRGTDAIAAEREAPIPCDVLVAPATIVRKGVRLSTVIDAIRRREGIDIPPLDVHATIARLRAELAITREALDRCFALDPDGARAVLAKLEVQP